MNNNPIVNVQPLLQHTVPADGSGPSPLFISLEQVYGVQPVRLSQAGRPVASHRIRTWRLLGAKCRNTTTSVCLTHGRIFRATGSTTGSSAPSQHSTKRRLTSIAPRQIGRAHV